MATVVEISVKKTRQQLEGELELMTQRWVRAEKELNEIKNALIVLVKATGLIEE